MKKAFFIIGVLFSFTLWAQEPHPKKVLQFESLAVQGATAEEAHVIERLIQSYLSQKDGFLVRSPEYQTSMPETSPPPDYIINGSLSLKDNNYVLELDVSPLDSPNVYRHISSHKSTGEMALSIRSIVEDTFKNQNQIFPQADKDSVEELRQERILGLWRGDSGIELVRILPDGKAFAFFASGVNMMLSYRIEKNVLIVTQISPNNERFYYPLPLPVAKKMAQEAVPMRWELLLYDAGASLRGSRFESTAEFENYQNIKIIQAAGPCEWSKMPR